MAEKAVKTSTVKITLDNFNSVVDTEKPVLMDFWAEWCMPCRMLGPILERLAEKYGDKVIVGKINVDEEQELGQHFQIRGIPNVMIAKDKKILHNLVGVRSEREYAEILDSMLSEEN
jgi:thioredoxin 1